MSLTVNLKLTQVVRAPRTQNKSVGTNPFEKLVEYGPKDVRSIDIGLADRRELTAEVTELRIDDRANEVFELVAHRT